MRFPEFKGEWNRGTLGDLLTIKNGKDQKPFEKENSSIPVYGTGGVIGFVDKPIFTKDSVGIGRKGTIDKPILLNYPFWTVDTLFYSDIHKGVNRYFLFSLLQTINWKKLNQSTGVPSLTSKCIETAECSFPNDIEQTKIASLFELIDKRIDVQRKIIEEKEQLKRWVNNACLWNKDFPKVALNKIIKERNLRTTTVHQYQVLSSAVTGLYSQMDYFKHQISSENDVGYKVVLLNDVVFSPQNLWMGNINFNESFEIGMVSPSYKVYSVNDGFVPFYLSLFLKTARMKYEYSVCSEQGASVVRRNLNEDEFLQIAIPMPDFKTQAAAAKKLKLIVKTIEIEKQCLEALTKEKSFLLSNLFI